MIWSSFTLALSQMGDARFRRVLFLGLGLTVALLFAVYFGAVWAITGFLPDTVGLPFGYSIDGLHGLLEVGSAVVILLASTVLMVPVASAFSGFFLEDVAQAVEDRHYPMLPPPGRQSLLAMMMDNLGFFALILAVNLVGLVLYLLSGPFLPLVFWALNGFLLGREYFTLVALRRVGRDGARALRSRHFWTIWGAGILMAAPLSVPLVNLFIPVLGAATFTHLFHRLSGARPVPPPR